MIDWYTRILELTPGPRPDFPFPGAWMYANAVAVVHMVGVAQEPRSNPEDLKLEHGAFRATGFKQMIARLEAADVRYEVAYVPTFPIVQINVWDPDGNHLHFDFHSDEMA